MGVIADMIKIKNLSKTVSNDFGIQKKIINNLTLSIEKGKITAITGEKGVGKTLFANLLANVIEPDTPLKYKLNSILIPEEPSSFPWLNVDENIKFGLNTVSETKIAEVKKLVGLDGYGHHYPNNNSVGFRFRIALARSIIRTPELVVIDNSLKAVAHQHKNKLVELLKSISNNKHLTILYLTSDIKFAEELTDKVLSFETLNNAT